MGLLALINGLLDPSRSDSTAELNANTHGIAPLAYLHVFSSFKANETNFNGTDLIYRARGIDVGRDRDDDGNLIADDDRNIVLVQNTIADSALSQAATQANIHDAVGLAGSSITDRYKSLYDALKVGVANTSTQDIYVFAAADGRGTEKDPGLLASIAGAQENSNRVFADYSLIVTAAEMAANAYCGSIVASFCITAPGAYNYIDKESGGSGTTYDDTDSLVAGTPTSNAAASLVAGGLAVLESIFGDQITSKDLLDRVIRTADTSFTGYDVNRHGQGMFNLEAASRPILRTNIPSRDVTGITSEATAKAIFTADTSSVTSASSEQLRIAKEYQNQPTLAQVNAADAYARGADSSVTSTRGLNLGQGSNISVITNTRFDPTHPEFSSSHSDASYDTLTRFYVDFSSNPSINNIADAIPVYFSRDGDELVQIYRDDSDFDGAGFFYVTIPVPALDDDNDDMTNPVAFETIARDDFNFEDSGADAARATRSGNIRTAFLEFMEGLLGGTLVDAGPLVWTITGSSPNREYYFEVNSGGDYLEVTDSGDNDNYNHIGRVYVGTSNIASYQIVGAPEETDFQGFTGNSLQDFKDIAEATDADMGLLALINGLLDPSRSDSAAKLNANTHGIAPLAYLHVFSSFKANDATRFNGTDLIYRARGIDVARDRDGSNNLIADDDPQHRLGAQYDCPSQPQHRYS